MKKCYFLMLIFTFCISSFGQTQSIHVNAGWNLLSLPLAATDSLKSVLFPTAVSSAFIYRDSYQIKDTLQNGLGFWLKFDTAETVSISGNFIYDDTIEVRTGWNIIGSLSTPIPVESIKCDPPDLIISNYFSYTGGTYHSTDTLQPGFGTWVKVNQDGNIIMRSLTMVDTSCPSLVSYSDKDYNTVKIGSQCWMKENLDVGILRPGTYNPTNNGIIEKYCYNDNPYNCNTYGGLYQWNEAMQYLTTEGTQGICPSGWHIPTQAEFEILSASVGGNGNALKAIGQGEGASNESGFSAMLGGFRVYDGDFGNLNLDGSIWTSSEYDSVYAKNIFLTSGMGYISFGWDQKVTGFSVRCIKN
jgi:uncharacterized protein (TIGR02145 family)